MIAVVLIAAAYLGCRLAVAMHRGERHAQHVIDGARRLVGNTPE